MKPPFDLTDKAVKLYGIEKGVVAEGCIIIGKLHCWQVGIKHDRPGCWIPVNDLTQCGAWREAWERWIERVEPLEGLITPPDGAVWLVRRECECRKRHSKIIAAIEEQQPTMEIHGIINCECKGSGHTHHLVREDAEPIDFRGLAKWESAEFRAEYMKEAGLAGLHFIMPERACDATHQLDDATGHIIGCDCNGTGTIARKTFDVWRDAK
jgi:hypothetical protein